MSFHSVTEALEAPAGEHAFASRRSMSGADWYSEEQLLFLPFDAESFWNSFNTNLIHRGYIARQKVAQEGCRSNYNERYDFTTLFHHVFINSNIHGLVKLKASL